MEKLHIVTVSVGDSDYPVRLRERLGGNAPNRLATIGAAGLLKQPLLALLCSVRCPGTAILEVYETAKKLAQSEWVVVSGFHSPMEKECLRIFLRAKHSVIVCPARSLDGMRISTEWREPIEAGRLLMLSSFTKSCRRNNARTAEARNLMVAAIADTIWISYMGEGSKTEKLVSSARAWGGTMVDNQRLFDAGVNDHPKPDEGVLCRDKGVLQLSLS